MKVNWKEYKTVAWLGPVVGLIILACVGLFYGLFASKLIAGHEAMTPEVRALITADSINVVTELVAHILYGYLVVLIFKWGKIHNPLFGGVAGALVALLSDLYYALCLYSTTQNMFTITSIPIDALTYVVVNFIVGAGLAWFLGKKCEVHEEKTEQVKS